MSMRTDIWGEPAGNGSLVLWVRKTDCSTTPPTIVARSCSLSTHDGLVPLTGARIVAAIHWLEDLIAQSFPADPAADAASE